MDMGIGIQIKQRKETLSSMSILLKNGKVLAISTTNNEV
jgi:hypothetical protein